jgi:hypothetical protein
MLCLPRRSPHRNFHRPTRCGGGGATTCEYLNPTPATPNTHNFHVVSLKVFPPFSRKVQSQNQDSKMANLLPCVEAAGLSICGCVVPYGTIFVLPYDVDCTGELQSGEAAIVLGDQAKVDLNGMILKGDLSPDGSRTVGILMNGTGNKLNGHGGTIDGFGDGVQANGATDVEIKNVNFINQASFSANARFQDAADVKITECSFRGSQDREFYELIDIFESKNIIVENNDFTVLGDDAFGVYATNVLDFDLTKNTFSFPDRFGEAMNYAIVVNGGTTGVIDKNCIDASPEVENTVGLAIATSGTESIALVAENAFTNLVVGILVLDAIGTIVEDSCFESNRFGIKVLSSLLNGNIIGNSFLDSGQFDIDFQDGADVTGTVIQEPSSSKKGSNTCGSCHNKGKGGKTGGNISRMSSLSVTASRYNRSSSDLSGRRVLTKGSR